MPAFLIATLKVTDETWVPEYAGKVHDIAAKHGGRYLSRSPHIKTVEGTPPDATLIAIIQFPSVEAAEDFAHDPEYVPFAKARQAGSVGSIQIIDDADAAGAIPYLPKA